MEAFHLDETRHAEVEASPARPPPTRPPWERAEIEPLTPDLRRMHLTVSRELLDALAVARDAVSHSHPGASDEAIIKLGLDLIIERHRKRRGIGCKPRRPATGAETSTVTAEKSRFHQDVSARQLYGDDVMNRFTAPKRGPRCSEPIAVYGRGRSRSGECFCSRRSRPPGERYPGSRSAAGSARSCPGRADKSDPTIAKARKG